MNKLETLFVVIDPTVERDFVVDRALHIAKSTSASVCLFINNANTLNEHSYLYEGIDEDFFETQRELFSKHYHQLLADLVEEFKQEGIEASSKFTEQHHLAEAILQYAEVLQPDLLLKSTHHHNVVERSLISNTDWRLIRKCQTPLLLVKPQPWNSEGSIVTAVDPLHSKAEQIPLDALLLDTTEYIAGVLDQTPRVFHSYFPFVSTMFPLGTASADGLERIRAQHEDKMKSLLAAHNIDPDHMELSQGELVPTLTNYLKEVDANVLVIGALSRNIIERAIVGNTAEKILEKCPCDVLVLKPAD